MDWEFWTLLVTVAGFGVTLVMLVRSMRKSNEAAHAKTEQNITRLDTKNEAAHKGIVDRIDSSRAEALARADRHAEKLDAVVRDVAFLAGRQEERDQQAGTRRAASNKVDR